MYDKTHAISLYLLKLYNEYKQDLLESGVNIKTINDISILGSGDIKIDVPTNVSAFTNDAKYVDEDTLAESISTIDGGTF